MYKNIFSDSFLFPIGHLTHPPTSKAFLDFYFLFIYMALSRGWGNGNCDRGGIIDNL